jgi:hypothetical protein
MFQKNQGIFGVFIAVALFAMLGCGGGGSSSSGGSLPQTSTPPTVTLQGWTPNDASLLQYKAYTFNASATDPNIGGAITEFHWDFGDGVTKVSPVVLANGQATATYTYAFVASGTPTLSVVAKNAAGLLSVPATRALTVNAAPSPLTVTFTAPTAPISINPALGGSFSVNFDIHVANTGTGTISASGIVLTSGDAGSTQATPVDLGNGDWRIVVTYPAAAAIGSRDVTPSVKVLDSNGISSSVVTGPVITIKTVSLINNPPQVTMTATPKIPAGTNSTWQGVAIDFKATATDPDQDTLTYSWTFGDGGTGDVTPTQSAVALTQTHTFATVGTHLVVFTADDGRTGGVKTISLSLNILANSAPTLTVVQTPAGQPYANVPVTFTATATDADGDTPTISWDFGDTTTGTGSSVIHSFLSAGTTVVKATADDAKGGVTTQILTLDVLTNFPPVSKVTTPATNLYQNKAYTFTASATDPDAGNTITQYQWDFGDGTGILNSAVTTISHTYAYDPAKIGAKVVKVRAVDNHGSTGDFSPAVNFTVVATSLPVVSFVSPGTTTLNADLNGTVTQAFTIMVTNPQASSGATDPIPVGNITFLPNDPSATITSSVSNGGGSYTFTVQYTGAAVAGTRTATPSAYATDSYGIQGLSVNGPIMTIKTLGTNHAPSITITDPASPTSSAYTSKPISLGFTLKDSDNDPVAYTVDWGDGTPTSGGAPTGDLVAGIPVTLAHTYADTFTGTATITVNATDNRSANFQAVQQTRAFTVTFNALPTAAITSPQDSGTAPTGYTPNPLPADTVVVPLNGKLSFAGVSTKPGSQDAVTSSWSFPSGVPSSFTGDTPGDVIFSGTNGVITSNTVTFTVTDAFGRTAVKQKTVLVDGVNTQHFNLSFQYRLKSDNNGSSSLTPVVTAGNGLGTTVQIFQDGLSNTYQVQDQAQITGAKASVSIPVRSDLPFYVEIPGFGADTTKYLMRIPNAPTGAYADPTLAATAPSGSSNFSFSASAPWDPTLQVVTAQGFAAESLTAPQRKLNGFTDLVLGTTPPNERWLDRLSVPLNDVTGAIPRSESSSTVGQWSGIPAYQLFAEWPTLLLTRKTGDLAESTPDGTTSAGKSSDLGFVLDYGTYAAATLHPSDTFAAFSMQAFRVPAGVTDPYQLSPAWQSPTTQLDNTATDPHAGLNPIPVAGSVSTFFNNLVHTSPGVTPLAGGIQDLPLPYDPNDPDRSPLIAPTTRAYSGIVQIFSYSEYLWSTVWARPLVLNSARPNRAAAISTFPYFRYSNPAAWPKASGISPDNSAFDLTVRGGGVFDASAPVALAPATAPATGVGRFFWTAFTPSYQGDANSGAAIARTWLADDSTKQPPTTFPAASATGDATVAFGFMTPQDTIVDKRSRNADGTLKSPTVLGGYRVTWFNPTKDASGNPVPPDFWVVELKDANGTKHFMLPGGYPTGTQAVTDLIMTDARSYLPTGTTPGAGATVAPGYCWFDIPVELRPTPGATLTVFAVKSILKNQPVAAARPLNRPDWIDAIKTATATMKMLTSSGADLTYAYKIPFNYAWDIVVASGPQTPVAP